jgi:hypothetical protein
MIHGAIKSERDRVECQSHDFNVFPVIVRARRALEGVRAVARRK